MWTLNDGYTIFILILQLEDGHSLFDYNIDLNCLVQVMIVPEPVIETEKCIIQDDKKPMDLNDEKPALNDSVDNNNQENEKNDSIPESSSAIEKVFFFLFVNDYSILCTL